MVKRIRQTMVEKIGPRGQIHPALAGWTPKKIQMLEECEFVSFDILDNIAVILDVPTFALRTFTEYDIWNKRLLRLPGN